MTDINTRGKLPFTIVSSSVNTGYATQLTSSVGYNIDIVNHHKDEYGGIENSPLQGPFTAQHVGGNQHRHVKLNDGSDDSDSRPEAYIISASVGSVKVYGPDINGIHKPRSLLTRDTIAKSSVNIKNIQTSGNVAGNFEHNYQVVQTSGRNINQSLIVNNLTASGSLTTKFSLIPAYYYSTNKNIITSSGDGNPSGDAFSTVISISGDSNTLAASSVGSDIPSSSAGGISVFKKSLDSWYEEMFLTSSGDGNPSFDSLGSATAVNYNGTIIAASYTGDVPVVNAGAVAVFRSGSSGWIQEDTLLSGIGSNIGFGSRISINESGNVIAVGAPNHNVPSPAGGAVFIYRSSSLGGWSLEQTLTSSTGIIARSMGADVKINFDGTKIAAGGRFQNCIIVFESGSSAWSETAYITGSSSDLQLLGLQISLNRNFDTMIAGAYISGINGVMDGQGSAVLFTSSSANGWIQDKILTPPEPGTNFNFGSSVDISKEGNFILIASQGYTGSYTSNNTGAVYLYNNLYDNWHQEQIIVHNSSSLAFGLASSVKIAGNGDRYYINCVSSSVLEFGRTYVSENNPYTLPDLTNDRSKSVFVERFSAPGDKKESSRGALDRESEQYSPNNSLTTRNIKVRQPYYNKLTQHAAQFNSGSTYKLLPDTGSVNAVTIHGINRNTLQKVSITGASYFTGSKYDNFWVQHAIPRTDLRYSWIADSVSSSQQPIEYQSYNLPYSISNSYNSNGAFTDLSFEQKGPFGDHLGISGAIDKDEMHVSTYTNTMYRDRKYLFFTSSNDCYVDASSISSEISERDFSISFWVNFPNSASNGEKTLLVYSGSSTQNELVMNVSSSLCGLTISGSQTTTEYQLSSSLLDNSWHLVTLTSDVTTLIRRIPAGNVLFYPTVTKVYLDGGLVSTVSQQNKIFNLSRITLSVGRGSELQGGRLDEIYFWNQVLTEQEIVEIYRTTKTDYNKQPKKYVQYKLDISNIPVPTHIYSSDIETNTTTLLDLAGSRNLTLVNFTSSVNIRPQDTGIISYSTYFNGPYQGASWKSIRNAEHPVTRKLTTDNTNIVSVVIPEGPKVITRVIRGTPVRITVPGNRKQGTILNVKESPVYANNKPLKHKFILKDSQNINVGFELTHTYANNLQYFASNQLNLTLGLDKKERQIYDSLLEYYNGSVEPNENPIDRFVGYTYSETIFPRPGQALLKDVRQRTDYITDQPGYSIDGYDRQLGTQRAFWRDDQEHRMRTRRTYITSLGDQVESVYDLPFQTPSIAALEYISESNSLEYISMDGGSIKNSFTDISYKSSAELNNIQSYIERKIVVGTFPLYFTMLRPISQIPEIYFFKNISNTTRDVQNIVIASGLYPLSNTSDPSSVRAVPKYVFEHSSYMNTSSIDGAKTSVLVYEEFTHDLGLNRFTEKISGKNPWYDSYEDYYIDVKALSNDNLITYSKIPEFKISDQISQLVEEYNGDVTKITLQEYLDKFQFSYKKSLDSDNGEVIEEDTINITVDTVKKLLPYNGFYPQDRSLQLVNYLKQSYLDSDAIGGGLLIDFGGGQQYTFTDKNDKLSQYMKESAFLETLYSPGIFYNLIKSGIAVDWNVYTGSLPRDSYLIPLTTPPRFKISFESLINLKNIPLSLSTSSNAAENRLMKYKEIDFGFATGDYFPPSDIIGSFQGFFEKLGEGSPLYGLSINNFLAETVNFFLKDSTLNTFISKPDSDFLSFDSNKTYYMDVVLRKNNIVMCEAHSSSLADSFGRMSGRYFGPSLWTGSAGDAQRIQDDTILAETLRDPGYCAYTPPYFYGDSIARMSFKPSVSSKYNLGDILQEMEIEFINTGFIDDNAYTSGSLYSSFVMPLNSSITLDGQIEDRQQTVQLEASSRNFSNIVRNNLQNLVGTATNATDIKRWVISPKMETPVLDFSNQEFVTSTTILTQSYVDGQLKILQPLHTPPTASGFGRGMWSGYGEIPQGDKGIFLELKESYPTQLSRVYNSTTRLFEETKTGSLLQACGFQQTNSQLSKKIGELADSRDISEAIVIIPYLLNNPIGRPVDFGGRFSAKATNNTVQIEGHNFIGIDQKMFNYQKTNLFANKPAVSLQDYDLGVGNIQETSISRMIGLMSKYVLPPNFDFLINENISPFVMYIAEFTSNLDKQDLADVWQGVMPKIAMRAEREKQIISHKNTQFDFFHGQGLPKDVKFMIFKAKKRAEINYYKMTSDSSDDGLFPSIQAGKPPSPYSFNWPYDYCSLVETATVNVEIEYLNNSGSNT